jgi:hypothetical protein
MNWVEIGAICAALASLTALVGLIGSYFTARQRAEETSAKVAGHAERLTAIEAELAAQRLHAAETYVREADLARLEERLGRRLEIVEQTIRETTQQIIAALPFSRRRRGTAVGE